MLLTGYVIYIKLKLNFTPGGVPRDDAPAVPTDSGAVMLTQQDIEE